MDETRDSWLELFYEFKAAKYFYPLAGRGLNLQRVKLLKAAMGATAEEITDLIIDAEDWGGLTRPEAYDLLGVDVVAHGRSRDSRQYVYVVAEVSITLSDQDVEQAATRAWYLAKATGQPAKPAVVAENVGPEQAELARRRQVTVLRMPSPWDAWDD